MRSSFGLHLHSHTCVCTHRNTHAVKEKHLRSSCYPTHPAGSCCSLESCASRGCEYPRHALQQKLDHRISFCYFFVLRCLWGFLLVCFVLGQISPGAQTARNLQHRPGWAPSPACDPPASPSQKLGLQAYITTPGRFSFLLPSLFFLLILIFLRYSIVDIIIFFWWWKFGLSLAFNAAVRSSAKGGVLTYDFCVCICMGKCFSRIDLEMMSGARTVSDFSVFQIWG